MLNELDRAPVGTFGAAAALMHGTPCLRDTSIPLFVVLDNLADGETVESILANYPGLRPEHVPAALAFAAELAR